VPNLMADTRRRLELLAQDPRGVTDPFDSIYKIVFQLTMRTVACNEIAEDPALLDKTLHLFESIERAATPTVVMYPSLPTLSKLKRVLAGAQLYMIFRKIVDERKRTDRRDHDALQYMMDHGDDIRTIITVSITIEYDHNKVIDIPVPVVRSRSPLCRPTQLRHKRRLGNHLSIPVPGMAISSSYRSRGRRE